MIEIVIKYDPIKQMYLIYEQSTDTLMASANLSEAICILNKFLVDSGMITEDLLHSHKVSYHLDSQTMISIIEGNLNLIKQLQSGPGSFVRSSQKFGASQPSGKDTTKPNSDSSKKGKSKGGFQSATGFNGAYKKFGF